MSRRTLNQTAYERLRFLIVTLALAPEEGFSEVELAERLGLGRAAVRYAIQRLAVERLLRVVPRGRTFVAPLSLTEIQQAFEVRTQLEALAARLAAVRATGESIRDLRACLETAEVAIRDGDAATAVVQDHRFHSAVAAAARNEILRQQLDVVMAMTERFAYYKLSQLGEPPGGMAHHWELFRAIERKNPDAAEDVVRRSFALFRRTLLSQLFSLPDDFGSRVAPEPGGRPGDAA